jgi:hypothetical protein
MNAEKPAAIPVGFDIPFRNGMNNAVYTKDGMGPFGSYVPTIGI